MRITGTKLLPASPPTVWDILHNPSILTQATPGIQRLTPVESEDGQKYEAEYAVKIGPLSGKFTGTVEVLDVSPPDTMELRMKVRSSIGNVNATARIDLKAVDENTTEVQYEGSAQLGGMLMSVGQRFALPTAKKMIDEFFDNLESLIKAANADRSTN